MLIAPAPTTEPIAIPAFAPELRPELGVKGESEAVVPMDVEDAEAWVTPPENQLSKLVWCT